MPIYYAKNSVKNISLYLKFLTYVQYRHDSIRKRIWQRMTSLYGWYDSPSPANDFKCVRIFQHENNKNSDKGAWYRTTDRKFSSFYCFCLSDRSDSPGIAEPEKWTRCPLNLTLMLFNPSWEYSTFDPRDCRIALIGLKWKKDKTHMIFSTIKSQVSVSDGIGQINKF